jgi:hypothetical protein
VDETGSGSCPVAGVGVKGVESLVSRTRELALRAVEQIKLKKQNTTECQIKEWLVIRV